MPQFAQRHLVAFLALVLILVPLASGCGRGVIRITNNEYRGILIAIGDTVPEDDSIVQRLQDIFTNASAFLYNITRKRSFFGDITILIPKSWSDKPEYQLQTRETVDKSDILIDLSNYGNRPFVVKCTPCGDSGHHMRLTPAYVINTTVAGVYGPYATTLIHEWAHLRYGVFDEYPDETSSHHFYAANNGELEGIRCSTAIRGRFFDVARQTERCQFENGLPTRDCHFQADEEAVQGEYASLMYAPRLEHITAFCDDDRSSPMSLHNRQAPNKQNKMCSGKSVWEVLREHDDFKNVNPPRDVETTVPRFRVVRESTRKTVLVLDTSGSMDDFNRIRRLARAASNYVRRVISDGEELGIVSFTTTAIIKSGLTIVNRNTRQTLLDNVPRTALGGTSIGAGLLEGLKVLQGASGKIILLSDGEETTPPLIESVMQSVINAGVTVDSIAVGTNADKKLESIAQKTGGLSFYFSDSDTSNALNDAFIAISAHGKVTRNKAIQLFSESFLLGPGGTRDVTVKLDSSVGLRTDITIGYSLTVPIVTMVTPAGRLLNHTSPEYTNDAKFNTSNFHFADFKEKGVFFLSITNPTSAIQELSLTATTHTRKEHLQSSIVAHAQWRKTTIAYPVFQILYVSISKGLSSILRADIKAVLEQPGTVEGVVSVTPLILRDNGAGADSTKDDGVYSCYVTNFTGDGRYSVRVMVTDDETTVVDTGRFPCLGAALMGIRQTTTYPVEPFQRFSNAGSFSLIDYVPGSDRMAPSKITDLEVSVVGYRQVTLQWTAPGDDLDMGTASLYTMWWSTDFDAIYENHTLTSLVSADMMAEGSLKHPAESGTTEKVVINLHQDGDVTFYFVILSEDDANNTSPMSNIVGASMKYVGLQEDSLQEGSNVSLIVGLVVGGLVLLLVAVAVAVAVHKHRKGG